MERPNALTGESGVPRVRPDNGPEIGRAAADIEQHEADDLYFDGVAAALAGKRAAAERLLRASLALNPQRHQAWLWLAGVVKDPQDSVQYLQRVLELRPGEPHALEGLDWAREKLGLPPDATPDLMGTGVPRPPVQRTTSRLRKLLGFTFSAAIILLIVAIAGYTITGPLAAVRRAPQKVALPATDVAYAPAVMQPTVPAPQLAAAGPETAATVSDETGPASLLIGATDVTQVDTSGAALPTLMLTLEPAVVVAPIMKEAPIVPPAAKAPAVETAAPAAVPEVVPPPLAAPVDVAPVVAPVVEPAAPAAVVWDARAFRPPWFPAAHPLTALSVPGWFLKGAPGQDIRPIQGKWIEVDLSDQVLRAYENGTLFMEVKVSTGVKATPTVKGTFRIQSKYNAIDMPGLPKVPYTMFFHSGGYALHGTYWHKKFGQPMSHGCVNMKTEDAKKLYGWAEPKLAKGAVSAKAAKPSKGTLVVIHD